IPAFCDSSSRFFRIRVGGFINREEAELFNTVFGAKNWLVFTAKDQSRVLPASSLCAFNGQNTLFVFRYDSGTLRLIHKIENFIKDYQGNPVIKDSTIEIRRNDGRKSIFYFKTGGIYEEIRDIQD
ncbi:MAG: hypothetical protein ABIL05_04055, partial [candidate division WOR-3 bacterium]